MIGIYIAKSTYSCHLALAPAKYPSTLPRAIHREKMACPTLGPWCPAAVMKQTTLASCANICSAKRNSCVALHAHRLGPPSSREPVPEEAKRKT